MNKIIKVLVSGQTGTGKTTISRVIEKALNDAGIQVEFFDPDDVNGNLEQFQDIRLDTLKDQLQVVIEEHQALRDSVTNELRMTTCNRCNGQLSQERLDNGVTHSYCTKCHEQDYIHE